MIDEEETRSVTAAETKVI